MIKFSVIVPVYNVEKYVDNCINSVISQTYDNFELLLIDDGSTDKSPQICDDWAKKDSRIKVIHKPNGGVSSARNEGIRQACGDNIIFIDADDFIQINLLERCLIYADKHDVFNYDWQSVQNPIEVSDYFTNKTEIVDLSTLASKTEYLKFALRNKKLNTVCWRSCYKTSFLKDNNLFFDERYSIAEDVLFNISLIDYLNELVEVKFSGVYHYWNSDSVCYRAKGMGKLNYMNNLAFNLCKSLGEQKKHVDIFPFLYLYLIEIGQEFIDINQDLNQLISCHIINNYEDFYRNNIKKALKHKKKIIYNEFRPDLYKELKIKKALLYYSLNHNKFKLKFKIFWINLTLPFVKLKTKISRRIKGLFKRGEK